MNIEAHLNNLRISPRKVRVVVNMLSGLSVQEADVQLDRELRRAALPLRKLLLSAVANAEHNVHAVRENLIVSKVLVNEGKKLKRWMPRAQGRATPIWKRMSRVSLVLQEVVSGMKSKTRRNKKSKNDEKKRMSLSKQPVKSGLFSDGIVSGGGSRKGSRDARTSRSIFHRKSV